MADVGNAANRRKRFRSRCTWMSGPSRRTGSSPPAPFYTPHRVHRVREGQARSIEEEELRT
eukprot:12933970-Prorocentrum_lima.AAC.1